MLSTEECRKYLKDPNISDERLTAIRDWLYLHISTIVDNRIPLDDNKLGSNNGEKEESTNN